MAAVKVAWNDVRQLRFPEHPLTGSEGPVVSAALRVSGWFKSVRVTVPLDRAAAARFRRFEWARYGILAASIIEAAAGIITILSTIGAGPFDRQHVWFALVIGAALMVAAAIAFVRLQPNEYPKVVDGGDFVLFKAVDPAVARMLLDLNPGRDLQIVADSLQPS